MDLLDEFVGSLGALLDRHPTYDRGGLSSSGLSRYKGKCDSFWNPPKNWVSPERIALARMSAQPLMDAPASPAMLSKPD